MTCIIAAKVEGGCLFAADTLVTISDWEHDVTWTPKVHKIGRRVAGASGTSATIREVLRIARQLDDSSLDDLNAALFSSRWAEDDSAELLIWDGVDLFRMKMRGGHNMVRGDVASIGCGEAAARGYLLGAKRHGAKLSKVVLAEAVHAAAGITQHVGGPVRTWMASMKPTEGNPNLFETVLEELT